MLANILKVFDLDIKDYQIQRFGDGLINATWKITDNGNNPKYILQQVNIRVFKNPDQITENIRQIGHYLSTYYPDYLFVSPIPSIDNEYMIRYDNEDYFRLFPYVENSITITAVKSAEEAFEAAKQFARFTRLLERFDISGLNYILPGFHDLNTRFAQFKQAVKMAHKTRLFKAQALIDLAYQYRDIAAIYQDITKNQLIPLRVIHHDTKISNVLFDNNKKGLCVIDLDTVMPGYFISDVGDMMRTYLCPVTEEEQDLSKISVREDIFAAIVKGYFTEMGGILTKTEKSLFVFAGKFMIYMQAIRFLTDFLNNDIYYHTTYADHNLVRAHNQFTLLENYLELENRFQQIVNISQHELVS